MPMCFEYKCVYCNGDLKETDTMNEMKQNDFKCDSCKSVFNYPYVMGLNDGYQKAIKDYIKEFKQ